MSVILYGINDYPVRLTKIHINALQHKFVFNDTWYYYNTKWESMHSDHVKSMLKTFLETINLYINTYVPHNYNILEKLLFKQISFDSKHLICFQNGTYDLKIHQFRKSCWSDYCTLQCRYNYEPIKEHNFNVSEDQRFVGAMYFIFIGKPLIIYSLTCLPYVFMKFIDNLFGSYNQFIKISDVNKHYRCVMDVRATIDQVRLIKKVSVICLSRQVLKETNACLLQPESLNHNYNAKLFMPQLITLDKIPIKLLIFKMNDLLVTDITNSILILLYDVMI